MNQFNSCRLCRRPDGNKFRYGSRHYAHAECGLKRWGAGFFGKLHLWQLNEFPVFAAKAAGLWPELQRAIAQHPEREPRT